MAGIAQGKPVDYHVLKHGEMLGPFAEEDLRAGVADGRFELGDFVQVEGQVVWQPLGRVLDASEEELRGAVAPDWMCILKWAWARLRYNLDERGALVGVTCLVLGTLAFALSNWPFVFWVPWFAAAVVVAVTLFRRKREGAGALILLAVISVPGLFHFFSPRATVEKRERVVQVPSVSEVKTPVSEPKSAPVPVVEPAPKAAVKAPEPIELEPVPVVTPSPVAIATITPHYGPAPAAPAEAPAATPATGSLISAAGKLAGAVAPFIAEKVSLPSLPSLPGLPGSAPAVEEGAAAITAGNDVLQSHNDAFVTVKGTNGTGSGFACRLGEKTWLFSNIHVVSEIKQSVITRLDGVILPLGAADAAAGPNIVRMVLAKASEHPLEAITDFEANVHIQDDVAVPGYTGGGSVVTWLKGRVVSISPDRVEVSTTFIPGTSGCPIIHLKTGKVIGVVSDLARRYDQYNPDGGNGSAANRHFGYRIDKVPAWEPVDWPELYAEADQLTQISSLTTDIFDFVESVRNQKEPTFATDTLRRPAQEWLAKTHTRGVSTADRRSATQGFLNALRFLVKADMGRVESRLRYTYFRNRLKDEEKVRERMFQAFDSEGGKPGSPLSQQSYR